MTWLRLAVSVAIGPLAGALVSAAAANAQVVAGRVVQRGSSVIIDDATVFVGDVVGSRGRTMRTSSQGLFRIKLDAAGSLIVRVRRLGFRPYSSEVLRLEKGDSVSLDVELEPVPQELTPVAVNAELEAIKDIRIRGYNARSIDATFITPSQLDAAGRGAHNYLDIMGRLRLLFVRIDHTCVRPLSGGRCYRVFLNDQILADHEEEIVATRLVVDPNNIDHIVLIGGGEDLRGIHVYTRDYTNRQRQAFKIPPAR